MRLLKITAWAELAAVAGILSGFLIAMGASTIAKGDVFETKASYYFTATPAQPMHIIRRWYAQQSFRSKVDSASNLPTSRDLILAPVWAYSVKILHHRWLWNASPPSPPFSRLGFQVAGYNTHTGFLSAFAGVFIMVTPIGLLLSARLFGREQGSLFRFPVCTSYGRQLIESTGLGVASAVAATGLIMAAIHAGIVGVRDLPHLSPWSNTPHPDLTNAVFVFWLLLAAPVSEELLFRRVLYRRFLLSGNPRLGAVVISLIFAEVHIGMSSLIRIELLRFMVIFMVSMILCFVFARFRNWIAPVVTHGMYNASLLALAFLIPTS